MPLNVLVANLAGTARTEILSGREYIVAPMVLIVPGVLSGSEGPLLYPPDEVSKDPQRWNGIPITLGHPRRNGQPISARDPSVLAVGRVEGAKIRNGKLVADAWLDVGQLRSSGPEVLNNLKSGKTLELSTGLFTDDEPRSGTYNGRPYKAVARNYLPDHLAIFGDATVGACSVADGCGVGVLNSRRGRPVTNHDAGCRCTGCLRLRGKVHEVAASRTDFNPTLNCNPTCAAKPTRNADGDEMRKWLGAGSYPVTNDDEDDLGEVTDDFKPSPMILPTINWAEEKRLLDARQGR